MRVITYQNFKIALILLGTVEQVAARDNNYEINNYVAYSVKIKNFSDRFSGLGLRFGMVLGKIRGIFDW